MIIAMEIKYIQREKTSPLHLEWMEIFSNSHIRLHTVMLTCSPKLTILLNLYEPIISGVWKEMTKNDGALF